MSWDISLVKRCECCNHKDEIEVGNYTYNVAQMYIKAMDCTLIDLDGMLAEDVCRIVQKGIADMLQNPDEYIKLNPSNGWGNYEGALQFLKEINKACYKNPEYRLHVY